MSPKLTYMPSSPCRTRSHCKDGVLAPESLPAEIPVHPGCECFEIKENDPRVGLAKEIGECLALSAAKLAFIPPPA